MADCDMGSHPTAGCARHGSIFDGGYAVTTREDRYYERAAQELSGGQLTSAAWGRAISLAGWDDSRARALYIDIRVGQLARDRRHAVAAALTESWPDIEAGRQFFCPHCETRTAANGRPVDYFVQCFTGAPSHRYSCRSCGVALVVGKEVTETSSESAPLDGMRSNPPAVIGFILGLVSVVLYPIGIVPLLAVVFAGVGIHTFDPRINKNRWLGGAGLALGVIYSFMALDHHGHFR